MAAASDQNLSDAASSLGRSSSIDARDGALPRSDSQRRSASKVGRKSGRSGNDLFMCFAPRTTLNLVSANRSVVSPARDKGKEVAGSARRSGRTLSSSIFSSKGAPKKQGFEVAEEPTSPKVTCIGQVRSKSKSEKNKGSPGAPRKHAEGKKESACSSFAKDLSCFGLPCDSYGSLPSFRSDKKSSGTVFAKSLVLIQQEDEGKKAAAVEASMTQVRVQSSSEKERSNVDDLDRSGFKAEEICKEISACPPAVMSVMAVHNNVEAFQSNEVAEEQTSVEEDDKFEAEPPPSNALLLMRNKVEHLRVLVPPPSINITLKRSTSAPAHCRRKSENGDDGNQMQGLANADHMSTSTEKAAFTEARREIASVIISSEDLPRPAITNASKSFLQRCKSVSRSLSRGSNEPGEEAKSSPATQGMKSGLDAYDMAVISEHKNELHLVSEALSRRRSDSEALKVSLDIVPETWLWEASAVAQQEPKEKTGSSRRLDMKQGGGAVAEWFDGELEAALWKSCHVAEGRPGSRVEKDLMQAVVPSPSLAHDANLTSANQTLDAEVEATLWRCCSVVASHSSEDPQPALESDGISLATGKYEVENSEMDSKSSEDSNTVRDGAMEDPDHGVSCSTKLNKHAFKQHDDAACSEANPSNLGRSFSVGSQNVTHRLEEGFSLRRCASVGTGKQEAERHKFEKKATSKKLEGKVDSTPCPQGISAEPQACAHQGDVGNMADNGDKQDAIDVHDVCDSHGVGIVAVSSSEGYMSSCIVEAELWCAGEPPMGFSKETECNDSTREIASKLEWYETTERHKSHRDQEDMVGAEEGMVAQPVSSVLDRPAPPPSPAPTTLPEAVLYLRYDLGAFRISLDGTVKGEIQADQHRQQQQKAMLEAISHLHIHGVQRTYTRLLKAASGKERASLSSAAFRLQRCKSEPVRLASY